MPSIKHLTKIIATIGPASNTEQVIHKLFKAGANCFRLNFSHGSLEDHQNCYDHIRAVEKKTGLPIGIIADLQGPKLRVGKLPTAGIKLKVGSQFVLKLGKELGNEKSCSLPHQEIFAVAKTGMQLLLDDGKLRLKVKKITSKEITTEVRVGGKLTSNKGVNIPDVKLPLSAITKEDEKNLKFALGLGVDWVALSFVQSPEDIKRAKKMIGGKAKIIAKIEKPQALAVIDEIIEQSDAVMVARGDLGVELNPSEVPAVQKMLIRKCRAAGCPVIIATQMLESMTTSPVATRAETSDVASAVYDGVDATMLSAESASGDYPVEAVTTMCEIIHRTETDSEYPNLLRQIRESYGVIQDSNAIVAAAMKVVGIVNAKCVVAFSQTGTTTLRASRLRPLCPLLGLTPLLSTARISTLYWGVQSILTKDLGNVNDMAKIGSTLARQYGLVKRGDYVVITAGVPLGEPGHTNLLRLATVEK